MSARLRFKLSTVKSKMITEKQSTAIKCSDLSDAIVDKSEAAVD